MHPPAERLETQQQADSTTGTLCDSEKLEREQKTREPRRKTKSQFSLRINNVIETKVKKMNRM